MWLLIRQQLETARTLVSLDRQRPKQASLRRAVSTAYYAVFQALCELCADTLVGWDQSWDVVTPIFRSLDHAQALRILSSRGFATTPQFERLGFLFNELQTAREWADYSPEPRPNFLSRPMIQPFTLEEADALIGLAEEAIHILGSFDPDTRLKLATRLVAKSRK